MKALFERKISFRSQHWLSLLLWSSLVCLMSSQAVKAQVTGHIDQPMTTARIVNIYWDSSRDSDNPQLTRGKVDAVTSAVVHSSYFAGLSEYGVTTLVFNGSLLPNKSCPQVAPSKVGFYDPVNTSIAGFVQCEHDNEPLLQRHQQCKDLLICGR
jgi:hypothetical protein